MIQALAHTALDTVPPGAITARDGGGGLRMMCIDWRPGNAPYAWIPYARHGRGAESCNGLYRSKDPDGSDTHERPEP